VCPSHVEPVRVDGLHGAHPCYDRGRAHSFRGGAGDGGTLVMGVLDAALGAEAGRGPFGGPLTRRTPDSSSSRDIRLG
jgi:hypothetical protein